MSQLDFEKWIEPDDQLGLYLDLKRQILEADHDGAFQAEAGTEDAQQEVLSLLSEYLPRFHGGQYQRSGDAMHMAGRTVDLKDGAMPALIRAGLLIQDDLVIMRRKPDGWHFSAGFVAFPSSWSVQEKFGQAMEGIHAQVPGFEGGTRNAELINRMFDKLAADRMVTRLNWSIKGNGNLPQPISKHIDDDPATASAEAMKNFVRVERQTLRRLPRSGDILFTIRVYADPITAIAQQPDAAKLFQSMADLLADMTTEQLAYKGLLTTVREPLRLFLLQQAQKAA
nr:DUF3445 domain-containing protein [Rhizobium sp. L1K21]